MDSDDARFRAALRRSLEVIGDAATPPRTFDELRVPSGRAGDERADRSHRGLSAGALVAIVALVGGLLVVRNRSDEGTQVGVVDAVPAAPATTVPPAPTTTPAAPPVETTVVSTVRPTTPGEPVLTVEEVRAMQADALRALPGFTAAVTKTVVDPMGGEPSEETAEVTLLADRSFWADQGLRGWGSYDPRTHIVRGAFARPDGTVGYQEIVGQNDGFMPLGILVGYDPTQLAMALPDDPVRGFSTDVIETTFEGRPVWEITAIRSFDDRCFEPCSPEAAAPKIEQTEVTTIDQETGIVIRKSMTSSQPGQQPQLSVLRGIRLVESMPVQFPGTFPDDAVVDRSGDPNALAAGLADVQALADEFGIEIPLPTGPIEISMLQGPSSMGGPDGVEVAGRFHTIEVASHDGFITSAAVNLTFSAPLAESPVPDGWTIVDGLYCMSSEDDGVCDDPWTMFGIAVDATVIESGALAGTKLVRFGDAPNGSIDVGPFRISISAPDAVTVLAIANHFEMVQPS